MNERESALAPGLRIEHLCLLGAVERGVGEAFACALDVQLAAHGISQLSIRELRLNATGLRARDNAAIEHLAARTARRILDRSALE